MGLFRKKDKVTDIEQLAAMEKYIEEHGYTEMAEFSAFIRRADPAWYALLVANAEYFKEFFWSRHRMSENPPRRRRMPRNFDV